MALYKAQQHFELLANQYGANHMLLNLDQFDKNNDIQTKIVDMSAEWGGDVKIKMLNFVEQLDFEELRNTKKTSSELILLLLQFCIVGEDNKQLFDESSVKILQQKSASSLFKLFNECLALNALDPKAVDTTAKN